MSVLEYFLRGLLYIQRKNTESGTEIVTKISGLLSCSNFMINAQRTSHQTDLHSNVCGCTVIIKACYNV